MKRTRRNQGAACKAQVAVAAVKGDKTLAELATQFGVHPAQITEWKQHVLTRAVDVFGGTKSAPDAPVSRSSTPRSGSWRWSMIVEKGRSSKRDG
jgi:transposase